MKDHFKKYAMNESMDFELMFTISSFLCLSIRNQIPNFEVGDRVGISKDLSHVKYLQENSNNGWLRGMEKVMK